MFCMLSTLIKFKYKELWIELCGLEQVNLCWLFPTLLPDSCAQISLLDSSRSPFTALPASSLKLISLSNLHQGKKITILKHALDQDQTMPFDHSPSSQSQALIPPAYQQKHCNLEHLLSLTALNASQLPEPGCLAVQWVTFCNMFRPGCAIHREC